MKDNPFTMSIIKYSPFQKNSGERVWTYKRQFYYPCLCLKNSPYHKILHWKIWYILKYDFAQSPGAREVKYFTKNAFTCPAFIYLPSHKLLFYRAWQTTRYNFPTLRCGGGIDFFLKQPLYSCLCSKTK